MFISGKISGGAAGEMQFMQNGAPPRVLPRRAWLESHFTGRWIGGSGQPECHSIQSEVSLHITFLLHTELLRITCFDLIHTHHHPGTASKHVAA